VRTAAQRTETWLIRGAVVSDPSRGVHGRRDVLVVGGRVAQVGERIDGVPAGVGRVRVVDADGLWLWPGLVDLHVHLRDPGLTQKETLASGTEAAARGGYTTVVCEPNTLPPIDTPERAAELARRCEREGRVRVRVKAAMTRGRAGRAPSDIEALARVPSVVALSDDGDPVTRKGVMEEVARRAARAGLPLSPHCEDSPRALQDYRAGADPGFEPGPPYENETRYIERDIQLAARWGCRVHFSHVSLRSSVELIRRFRDGRPEARNVSFEVTPHHLLLSAEDFAPGEAPLVNPPLRSADDRLALQEALGQGLVDAIASDHAPHTAEDKALGARGLIGLETTLGLVLTYFVHPGRLSVAAAVRLLSTRPAQALGLAGGSLAPGGPADLVLIDPGLEWEVRGEQFASLARNTPCEGWRLRGRAVGVLVGGAAAFVHDSLLERMRAAQGRPGR